MLAVKMVKKRIKVILLVLLGCTVCSGLDQAQSYNETKGNNNQIELTLLSSISTTDLLNINNTTTEADTLKKEDTNAIKPLSLVNVKTDLNITSSNTYENRTIIIITSTYDRPSRIPDMVMITQSFMLLKNIFWIVIEEDTKLDSYIEKLLKASKIPHVYLQAKDPRLPCFGWAQKNKALDYIREHSDQFGNDTVVYFANDGNAYNVKLFDEYIRKVDSVGVWGAGAGYVLVEAPMVLESKVIGWNTLWRPKRTFALNFQMFALNIKHITQTYAKFDLRCSGLALEDCFLRQLNLQKDDLTPFGQDRKIRPLYVWHRRIDTNSTSFMTPTAGFVVDELDRHNMMCNVFNGRIADISLAHAEYMAEKGEKYDKDGEL